LLSSARQKPERNSPIDFAGEADVRKLGAAIDAIRSSALRRSGSQWHSIGERL